MSHFVASPPIERRHARQRVSEECCRKALLLSQLLPAIAISQCQRIRPNARRELKQQSFIQDFGHRSPPEPCIERLALRLVSDLAAETSPGVALGALAQFHAPLQAKPRANHARRKQEFPPSCAAKPIPRTAEAALHEDGTADTSLRICTSGQPASAGDNRATARQRLVQG
jgi:hypothetical protein